MGFISFGGQEPPLHPRFDFLSRPVPSRPVPSRPVPSRPVPSRPVPSRPVPSRPVPSRPVPSRPVPSRPVPSRPVPSHLLPRSSHSRQKGILLDNCLPRGARNIYVAAVSQGSTIICLTPKPNVCDHAVPRCPVL